MFRSSTILSGLVESLAKFTLLLKHSVELRRILCGDVAACREMACVLLLCRPPLSVLMKIRTVGAALICADRQTDRSDEHEKFFSNTQPPQMNYKF